MDYTIRSRTSGHRILFGAALALVLCGCQELQGPVWSPDGQYLAFTLYTGSVPPGGRLETNLYLVDPEDATTDDATLLSRDAAFPHWAPDGPTLYFLGKRDKQGFYTALMMHRPAGRKLGEGMLDSIQENVKLVGFQLSIDGGAGILCSARDSKPGSPQTLEFFETATKTRTPIKLGEVYSPALSPNGSLLAYAQVPAGKGRTPPLVAILELGREPLAPQTVFPTADADEPGAESYVIHAFPDNDRFLFYSPTGKAVWIVRRDSSLKRFALPAGCSAPLMVAIAEDGKRALVTLAKSVDGELQYSLYELQFSRDGFTLLEGGASDLVGGHSGDPRTLRRNASARWAWLCPAGLAVGAPGKARFFSKTAEQYLAASRYLLQQSEPAKAVAAALKAREIQPPPRDPGALDRTEAKAFLAANQGGRAAEALERALLLCPIGMGGLKYVFPVSGGWPAGLTENTTAVLSDMDAVIAAAPEDKLLTLLRTALLARIKGDSAGALAAYKQAEPQCAIEALAGGVKFQEALASFESGDLLNAGERWESAARSTGFPQADYAAGLSAIAFALDGRPASEKRAEAVMKLGLALSTPLKGELQKLLSDLQGKAYKQSRLSDEAKFPDKQLRAWVEVTEYLIPQACLRPARILGPDRKYADRRIGATLITTSVVQAAGLPGGTQTLARIPRPISTPAFSPSGEMLSFLVQGEIFPFPDSYCEACVIDLRGSFLAGDAKAIASGRLSTRTLISSTTWTSPIELRVSGSTVDLFGNETPLQKALTVVPR